MSIIDDFKAIDDLPSDECAKTYTAASIEDLTKLANEQTADLVVGNAHTLLCDLDSPEATAQFHRMYEAAKDVFGFTAFELWNSKSGNVHAKVDLSVFTPQADRIVLQTILGSDPMREFLHLKESKQVGAANIVLFRPRTEPKPEGEPTE